MLQVLYFLENDYCVIENTALGLQFAGKVDCWFNTSNFQNVQYPPTAKALELERQKYLVKKALEKRQQQE